MRDSIRKAIEHGMPCIAECGGFLYLHRELEGDDGKVYPMVGVIDGKAYRTPKLGRFGYITLEAKEDQLLGKAGTKIRGHEFHYWDSTCCGESFHAAKPTGKRNWDCVCGTATLYAGFPHLFFYSNREAAGEFLRKCEDYKVC
jgi:cobyrinic acid a,c-diamide synthase